MPRAGRVKRQPRAAAGAAAGPPRPPSSRGRRRRREQPHRAQRQTLLHPAFKLGRPRLQSPTAAAATGAVPRLRVTSGERPQLPTVHGSRGSRTSGAAARTAALVASQVGLTRSAGQELMSSCRMPSLPSRSPSAAIARRSTDGERVLRPEAETTVTPCSRSTSSSRGCPRVGSVVEGQRQVRADQARGVQTVASGRDRPVAACAVLTAGSLGVSAVELSLGARMLRSDGASAARPGQEARQGRSGAARGSAWERSWTASSRVRPSPPASGRNFRPDAAGPARPGVRRPSRAWCGPPRTPASGSSERR